MKRIIAGICAIILLQCAYAFNKKVLFIKDNVNLREDPNTSCKIEGKLWKGCMLDYISEEDGWTMVVWPDEKDSVAFVSSSLVKVLDFSPVTKEALNRSYTAMGQTCDAWHDGTLSFDCSRLPYVSVSDAGHAKTWTAVLYRQPSATASGSSRATTVPTYTPHTTVISLMTKTYPRQS